MHEPSVQEATTVIMSYRSPPIVLGLFAALMLSGLFAVAGVSQAATEVTTCGQSYSGNGFLSADLDCTGFPGDAITVDGGSLDLRGFTLTGGNANGVICDANCQVKSEPPGGRIINANGVAIGSGSAALLRITGVELDGNVSAIVSGGPVTVEDSVITNSGPTADILSNTSMKLIRTTVIGINRIIAVGGPIKVVDSQISNCAQDCLNGDPVRVRNSTIAGAGLDGIVGSTVAVRDSEISGHAGAGIRGASKLRVIRSAITGNAGRGVWGMFNGRARIAHSDVSGNDLEGVFYLDHLRITDSTITSNGRSGISTGTSSVFSSCRTLHVSDSTVTGNGTDVAVCGVTETCADLATCLVAPVLNDSSCDTSYDTESGFPGTSWGVCSSD
jgi:hypothetical protein